MECKPADIVFSALFVSQLVCTLALLVWQLGSSDPLNPTFGYAYGLVLVMYWLAPATALYLLYMGVIVVGMRFRISSVFSTRTRQIAAYAFAAMLITNGIYILAVRTATSG